MLKKSRNGMLCGLLTLLLLTACATESTPSPPVIVERVKLTPLPSSVTQIDSASSAGYLSRASTWLSKVAQSLDSATSK